MDMNSFESKGIEFAKKIDYLVKRKDLKTGDSLLKVLDCIKLEKGYHMGLKVARDGGLGDESYFYTYCGNEDPFKADKTSMSLSIHTPNNSFGRPNAAFYKNFRVEPSEMGAWQIYLLWLAPTILPYWWHGGYIAREYFFDREKADGFIPDWSHNPIKNFQEKIPQPIVTMKDNEAVVICPYWNNWHGLVLESTPIAFKPDGKFAIKKQRHKVLYEYNCGIVF